METWKGQQIISFFLELSQDFQPEVMTLNEHILYKDIWVAAVVEVPPNVSLMNDIYRNVQG